MEMFVNKITSIITNAFYKAKISVIHAVFIDDRDQEVKRFIYQKSASSPFSALRLCFEAILNKDFSGLEVSHNMLKYDFSKYKWELDLSGHSKDIQDIIIQALFSSGFDEGTLKQLAQ